MEEYDYIIAGGGAAGLSLVYHILQSPLKNKKILLVDPQIKAKNDRTWCFWMMGTPDYDEVIYHRWDQLAFYQSGFAREFDLAPYRYYMLRGIDFYQWLDKLLKNAPRVTRLTNKVESIVEDEQGAEVLLDSGDRFHGQWVFDSRFLVSEYHPNSSRYHYLKQHFKGWEIETPAPAFDPQKVTLFDFRTPSKGSMRFMYLLPFSPTHALVEYTLFSADLLPDEEYAVALQTYLKDVLKIPAYTILQEENGVIPMSDQPFSRKIGQHTLAIGTRGGRVKPSSGYAFLRIQQDSRAIVNSLLKHDHPFSIAPSPNRYSLFDSLLLQILYRQGETTPRIFTQMFKNNPPARIFRFLDESGDVYDNLRLIASLPPLPFLKALVRTRLLHKI